MTVNTSQSHLKYFIPQSLQEDYIALHLMYYLKHGSMYSQMYWQEGRLSLMKLLTFILEREVTLHPYKNRNYQQHCN